MVAPRQRISRRSEFQRTLKSGVRVSTRDLVVHVAALPCRWPDESGRRVDVATVGGPWLGLIISKAVGPAVVRHRVARRLRAAFASSAGATGWSETMVVVRARRSASACSSSELAAQLRDAFTHRRVRTMITEAGAHTADPSPVTPGATR